MLSKSDIARKFKVSVSLVEKAIRGERDSPQAREIRRYWESHTNEFMQLAQSEEFLQMMTFIIEKGGNWSWSKRALTMQSLMADELGVKYRKLKRGK